MSLHWKCPFCHLPQIATDVMRTTKRHDMSNRHAIWPTAFLFVDCTVCSNPACRQMAVSAKFDAGEMNTDAFSRDHFNSRIEAEHFNLRPTASFKVQPPCVPQVLAADYYEACQIRDLSPKASATLSRRVLQGMIRDFCKIAKKQLVDEIKELKKRADDGAAPAGVTIETIEAMDHVRSIGNIGAHMEADINVIVDVDPNEAQQLIELIEMLFDEWYVARDARQRRLESIKATAEAKAAQKLLPPQSGDQG